MFIVTNVEVLLLLSKELIHLYRTAKQIKTIYPTSHLVLVKSTELKETLFPFCYRVNIQP